LYTLSSCFDPISAFAQNVITHSQKKSEKLRAVVSGHQELAALDKRISDEKTKSYYVQRELNMLKQERTRETWLLKNDQGKPLLPSSTCIYRFILGSEKTLHQRT
jgi:hypothetical protein